MTVIMMDWVMAYPVRVDTFISIYIYVHFSFKIKKNENWNINTSCLPTMVYEKANVHIPFSMFLLND